MYKNPNVAFWLSFIFGPVGYLYVNPAHAAIMIIITIFTGGVGILITWPTSFILARKKAEEYNRFVGATPQQQEQQPTMPKKPTSTGFKVVMVIIAIIILLPMYSMITKSTDGLTYETVPTLSTTEQQSF